VSLEPLDELYEGLAVVLVDQERPDCYKTYLLVGTIMLQHNITLQDLSTCRPAIITIILVGLGNKVVVSVLCCSREERP